ncbi:Uncharacterized protein TCM_035047 [Theobroma cacao]|uniref:Uncharacterized protein n=1 Tax=Theobroma cacao TaxID=3641 RepID=A0A061FH48_THECC|nr:Uncharacterized protein TCM_035047 [Theobroma cacao]
MRNRAIGTFGNSALTVGLEGGAQCLTLVDPSHVALVWLMSVGSQSMVGQALTGLSFLSLEDISPSGQDLGPIIE